MKIYVASSWRNAFQPSVVAALREAGHFVYDFRNPSWDDTGFQWSEIDPDWQEWDFSEYRECLNHPIAKHGFDSDMNAMDKSEACVLVLPCGRSAHLELGWFVGRGRKTCILHPPTESVEPELMAKMVDAQFNSTDAVINYLATDCQGRTPFNT